MVDIRIWVLNILQWNRSSNIFSFIHKVSVVSCRESRLSLSRYRSHQLVSFLSQDIYRSYCSCHSASSASIMAPSAISPTVLTANGASVPLYGTSPETNNSGLAVQEPEPNYHGYHHVTWWVGNAKQAASYYVTRMGFKSIAYAGLETGSRLVASHVVENGNVRFVFSSPIRAAHPTSRRSAHANGNGHSNGNGQSKDDADVAMLQEMHEHLEQHGDAVKDVAFEVDDVRAVYARAVEKGAVSVQEPRVLSDSDGEVLTARVRTYGDTTHTFIEKLDYKGVFIPGFKKSDYVDPLSGLLPDCPLEVIDHCVGNQDWDEMEEACDL
jgi:4-hydroxyphenylpyruvate dioxygenase